MVTHEHGTLYFDTSGTGYLLGRGVFVFGVGREAHEKFVEVFDTSGITRAYDPVDVVNKLVSAYGLVVVQVTRPEEDEPVLVVSKSKKSALDPTHITRVEDTFELTPNEPTVWTDHLLPDGRPGRSLNVPARVSIYGEHEYRQPEHDKTKGRGLTRKEQRQQELDRDYREFEKTVRPEPKPTVVLPPEP